MGNRHSRPFIRYILMVGVGSFIFTVLFSLFAETSIKGLRSVILPAFLIVLSILVNVLFDIVGTSATAADEAPFHARAAKRLRGAQESIMLIKNADKVANFANDVVGDIAATIAGALGISLALKIAHRWSLADGIMLNVVITSLIASVTVVGKAIGKRIAVSRANEVIFLVGQLLALSGRVSGERTYSKKRGQGNRPSRR